MTLPWNITEVDPHDPANEPVLHAMWEVSAAARVDRPFEVWAPWSTAHVKLANLRAVRERFPDCRYVFTTVAGANAPMNAVNELLGFRDVERQLEMQLQL